MTADGSNNDVIFVDIVTRNRKSVNYCYFQPLPWYV